MVPAGGSIQLGQLIDERCAELTYDLRSLGVDIRDLFRDGRELTPRYVLILHGQLPDTSASYAAQRGGPEYRPWTATAHLLATLVNLTYAGNRQRGGKPTKKPLIEPPNPKKKPSKVTVAELLDMKTKKL